MFALVYSIDILYRWSSIMAFSSEVRKLFMNRLVYTQVSEIKKILYPYIDIHYIMAKWHTYHYMSLPSTILLNNSMQYCYNLRLIFLILTRFVDSPIRQSLLVLLPKQNQRNNHAWRPSKFIDGIQTNQMRNRICKNTKSIWMIVRMSKKINSTNYCVLTLYIKFIERCPYGSRCFA